MSSAAQKELQGIDKKLKTVKKRRNDVLQERDALQEKLEALDKEIKELKKKRRLNPLGKIEADKADLAKRNAAIREILWCSHADKMLSLPVQHENDLKDEANDSDDSNQTRADVGKLKLFLDDALANVSKLKKTETTMELDGGYGSENVSTEYALSYTYKDQLWRAWQRMDDGSLKCSSDTKVNDQYSKAKTVDEMPPGAILGHFWTSRFDCYGGPLEGTCACDVSLNSI